MGIGCVSRWVRERASVIERTYMLIGGVGRVG